MKVPQYYFACAVEACLQTDADSFALPRLREEAMLMIRRLIRLMETLKPLPEKKVLTFKLFYYDDATPDDYNPPLYKDSTNEIHPFFASPPFKVAVGGVGSVRYISILIYVCCHVTCKRVIRCRSSIL